MSRLLGASFSHSESYSAGGAAVMKATPPPMDLAMFGADSRSVLKVHGARGGGNEMVIPTITGAERPSNMWFHVPDVTAYWNYYRMMDWYRSEVSVLSTVIQRSSTELTRYGLSLEKKFHKKCMQCGYEAKTNLYCCPQCGSKRLRRPEDAQKRYFRRPNGKSFLDEANDNGQSMKDVLRSYSEYQYLDNQAYTLCVTGDMINPDTGQLVSDAHGNVRQYPLEFLCIDPKFVRYLYDDTGKPGTKYGFVMKNRSLMFSKGDDGCMKATLANNELVSSADGYHAPDGSVLYPAVWQIGSNYGGTGDYLLYTQEEVYQDKWFRQSLTYGMPVWLDIEDDLLCYHFIEKHNLKKYEYGYVRKILILPGFSQQDAEMIANGVQDVLATNDNSIPIVCLPPQVPGTPEMKAQSIELGTESSADLMQIKNDIRDRICSFIGVPNLFAGDTENGGMNNESQQITLFDRYLMDKYDYLDRQCRWVMSWFPMITDWELRVTRPAKADVERKERMDNIQEAQGMKGLGMKVTYIDGEFTYSQDPVMDQMGGAGGAGGNSFAPLNPMNQGGQFGGNTMGGGSPQGKNGQFQPDSEMNDTKSEINSTADEANDAFMV